MNRETDSATLPLGAVLREGGRSNGAQHGIRVEPDAICARATIPPDLVGKSRGAMRAATSEDQPAKDYRLVNAAIANRTATAKIIISATVAKRVLLNPQCGHAPALVLTSHPHSLHFRKAI